MTMHLPALPAYYPDQAFTWAALVPQQRQELDARLAGLSEQLARVEDAVRAIQESQAVLAHAVIAAQGGAV